MRDLWDVIVVGSGPAGLTAALYTSRARLRTLIIEKNLVGGELMNRDLVENYPGYPEGILGPKLGSSMAAQAMSAGAEVRMADIRGLSTEGRNKLLRSSEGDLLARSVIIATGSRPRKLGIAGEAEFEGKGVFYCATCDGPKFASKIVVVVGGGDSGVTEAIQLAGIVSKVLLVEVAPRLTATRILQERALSTENIEVRLGTRIEAIHGGNSVESVRVVGEGTGLPCDVPANGVLLHVGIEPNTQAFRDAVPLNERGQVVVGKCLETRVPGVFAAGDVRQSSPCQVSTAVGDGATAAISAGKFLYARAT